MKKSIFFRTLSFIMLLVVSVNMLSSAVFASDDNKEVMGKVYEFDKNANYEFDSADSHKNSGSTETYGKFSVKANAVQISLKDGIPAYKIDDGKLSLIYSYSDEKLNAADDEWHIIEDKSKKLDAFELESNIQKGAIVVQTSKDRKNWVNVSEKCNAFADTPSNMASIYDAQDIQIINGCYYRVIVAYELAKNIEQGKILFVETNKYDYKKIAEVYELYAYSSDTEKNLISTEQTYNLGQAIRTDKLEGYVGEKSIVEGDPHYGITLGQFYVSGYTDTAKDGNGDMVFLKNVGDKVVLWFSLKENIDSVGGNKNIKVTPDESGSDQYFQTENMDFGRGSLIVRYTDYNNNVGKPQIYTNYLEANASVGADTKVSLFEEGDYEVALDYELTEDKLINKEAHYRIFFKFSIRNGNCMVYPFDLATGAELTNSSMTENGFRLDLAKSRYLKVIVKREVMAESADGLVEDTRFNGPAKDGEEYTTEGIYTITVTNQYTNQLTVKKIYVGKNPVLRAYITTGLSIPEINNLVAEGATIKDDGSIQVAGIVNQETEEESPAKEETVAEPVETETVPKVLTKYSEVKNEDSNAILYIFAVVAVAVIILIKSKKKKTGRKKDSKDDRGND